MQIMWGYVILFANSLFKTNFISPLIALFIRSFNVWFREVHCHRFSVFLGTVILVLGFRSNPIFCVLLTNRYSKKQCYKISQIGYAIIICEAELNSDWAFNLFTRNFLSVRPSVNIFTKYLCFKERLKIEPW